MNFTNRWRIEGVLTTTGPFHTGNGAKIHREGLTFVDEHKKKTPIEISATCVDAQGKPCLPGKTLKGNLRAWLQRRKNLSAAVIEQVFGTEAEEIRAEEDRAVGGKAEFWDAIHASTSVTNKPPYWDPDRATGVTASVAIRRSTRTANPQLLFHEEFVPSGVSFQITITGQDFEDTEMELLLLALEGFNCSEDPATAGAGSHDGGGRFRWALKGLFCLDRSQVAQWLAKESAPVGYDELPKYSNRPQLEARVMEQMQKCMSAKPRLILQIALHFDGPFLVNDPSNANQIEGADEADHVPLRNSNGLPYLPARSLRGAFRSRAEKIMRTFNEQGAGSYDKRGAGCDPIYDLADKNQLCLMAKVFGSAGWRSPLWFSDFVPEGNQNLTEVKQEFVAIDRFTGGAAKTAKFNARFVYQPVLSGEMILDLDRIDPWAIGLLALTLRDLLEGDITLGFGASKGYGACTAEIKDVQLTGLKGLSTPWSQVDGFSQLQELDFTAIGVSAFREPCVQNFLKAVVRQLREVGKFTRAVPAT